MEFKHTTILVLGAGVSGIAVAGILQKHGGRVILNDAKSASKIQQDFTFLERCGVQLIFGRQDESLLADIDYLIVSPGISIHLPLVQTAKALGITVMSEIEVAYRLCRAPIVAITGTNGKTTTTTLIGDMLRTTGRDIVVGGNIGAALSKEVENIGADGLVVAEISSFQLEGIISFRPQIAAVLNITPDHLDRHHSIDLYQQTKEHIFKNQTPADYLVLNYDDEKIRPMAERAAAKVMYFSRKEQLPQGVFVQQGSFTIAWDDQTYVICPVADLKIKGAHNVENVLAACGVAFLAGVEPARLAAVIKTFQGVEHRIEFVAGINGAEYYNDSKATNPESSIKALEAFAGNVILIAGGRDKMTDLAEFTALIKEKVDQLILLGEAKDRFRAAAIKAGVVNIHTAPSLDEAVILAHHLAKPEQIVLLSPACSSYDMFANYEERGKTFKNLVRKLG